MRAARARLKCAGDPERVVGAELSSPFCGRPSGRDRKRSKCVLTHKSRATIIGSMPVFVPPLRLISRPMQCPMVAAAKWHRELVTYSASHGAVLCKSDVMGVSRMTAADQTRLGRHVLDVIPIPDATWFRYGEKALVDRAIRFFARTRRDPRHRSSLTAPLIGTCRPPFSLQRAQGRPISLETLFPHRVHLRWSSCFSRLDSGEPTP